RADTGSKQLIAIGGPQFQSQVAGRRPIEPARELLIARAAGPKRVDQLGADRIAARADARTDGGDEVAGLRAKLARHGLDRRPGHASCRATPAPCAAPAAPRRASAIRTGTQSATCTTSTRP